METGSLPTDQQTTSNTQPNQDNTVTNPEKSQPEELPTQDHETSTQAETPSTLDAKPDEDTNANESEEPQSEEATTEKAEAVDTQDSTKVVEANSTDSQSEEKSSDQQVTTSDPVTKAEESSSSITDQSVDDKPAHKESYDTEDTTEQSIGNKEGHRDSYDTQELTEPLEKVKTSRQLSFEKIINLANDKDLKWERMTSNDLFTIDKIKTDDSPVVLLRAWACLRGVTPDDVYAQICDTDKRAKWDTVLGDLHIVEKLQEGSEIIYFYIKTPFGTTERDFLQLRNVECDYPEKGSIAVSFQGCEHASHPITKKRIRGDTILSGYVIKPSEKFPDSTDFCILSQVDIKGYIPRMIVNRVAEKTSGDWIIKLKEACDVAQKNA